MVEDTPNGDNHQELVGYFKTKGEKLFFGLKVILISLYIFAKYLALKSLILLKGLTDITLLPLSLTFAVFAGLTSEKFSIILTILIYCILTYRISPKLMKPLFGDFGGLWWVQIVALALACVYLYSLWLMLTSSYASDYATFHIVGYSFIAFILLSSIPLGKMILNKSDMVQWRGPLPTFYTFASPADELEKEKEEQIREYNGESDDPWVKRKMIRCVPAYASGLVFSFVCLLLGLLFSLFLVFGILLAMFLIVWLMNDLYYIMRKKSLFKLEGLKNVFVGQQNPEERLTSSILSFKRHAFVKQVTGLICILTGISVAAGISAVGLVFFVGVTYLAIETTYNDLMAFLVVFIGLAYAVSVVLANMFQLYFWYILMKRFPHFLEVWSEKDFSTDVDAPKLPTGGFPIFLVNTVIIVFLFSSVVLLDWISNYSNVSADTTWKLIYFIAIVILSLCFEIYILYSTLKNRRVRDTNPNILYKDNRRIPFAVLIQSFTPLGIIGITASQGSDATSEALHIILLSFIVSCLLIQFFYLEDFRLYLREQDSEGSVKQSIKEECTPYIILAFMIFLSGYSIDCCWGTKIAYLGIFAYIAVVGRAQYIGK